MTSFFEILGIIIAVLFGCVLFTCVALGLILCCYVACCSNTNPNANPNRERRFFTNLNITPRRDFNYTVPATLPLAVPIPTAPPMNSSFPVSDTENMSENMDLPPSYAEVTMTMEKKL